MTLYGIIFGLLSFLVYWQGLMKVNLPTLRRIFILTATFLSVFFLFYQGLPNNSIYRYVLPEFSTNGTFVASQSDKYYEVTILVIVLYVIVACVNFAMLLKEWIFLQKLKRQSHRNNDIYWLPEGQYAFSHFHSIFISKTVSIEPPEIEMIIEHERMHGKLWHSLDIIALSVLKCCFWVFPIWQKLINELKLVHEMEVDQYMTRHFNTKEYALLLLQMSGSPYQLSHSFAFGSTSKRINNMLQIRSSKRNWLYFLAIIIVAGLFACRNENIDSTSSDEVFSKVDEFPRFPGCEDIADTEERNNCASQKLFIYLSQEITYPEKAKQNKTAGKVYVQFIVETNGAVSNVKVVRTPEPDDGLGEEARRVVEAMNDNGIRWTPGYKDGKKVRVQLTLPINFQLE